MIRCEVGFILGLRRRRASALVLDPCYGLFGVGMGFENACFGVKRAFLWCIS